MFISDSKGGCGVSGSKRNWHSRPCSELNKKPLCSIIVEGVMFPSDPGASYLLLKMHD